MRLTACVLAAFLATLAAAACSDDPSGPAATDAALADVGATDAGGDLAMPDPGPDPGTPDAGADPGAADPGATDPGAPDAAADPGPAEDAGGDPGAADAAACPATLVRLNEAGTLGDGVTDSGTVYAIAVTPQQAGEVTRIELMTAGSAGPTTATVALHDDAGGQPAITPLASGTLTAEAAPAWAAADLDTPVAVAAGVPLWVVFAPQGLIVLPQATVGADADYLWGFGFGDWLTAAQQAPWMVRLVQGCP